MKQQPRVVDAPSSTWICNKDPSTPPRQHESVQSATKIGRRPLIKMNQQPRLVEAPSWTWISHHYWSTPLHQHESATNSGQGPLINMNQQPRLVDASSSTWVSNQDWSTPPYQHESATKIGWRPLINMNQQWRLVVAPPPLQHDQQPRVVNAHSSTRLSSQDWPTPPHQHDSAAIHKCTTVHFSIYEITMKKCVTAYRSMVVSLEM